MKKAHFLTQKSTQPVNEVKSTVNNNPESKSASSSSAEDQKPKAKTPTPPRKEEQLLTPPTKEPEKADKPEEDDKGTPTKDEKPNSVMDGWKFSPTKETTKPTGGENQKDQKFDAYKNLAENKKKRDMILKTDETKTPSPAPGKKDHLFFILLTFINFSRYFGTYYRKRKNIKFT